MHRECIGRERGCTRGAQGMQGMRGRARGRAGSAREGTRGCARTHHGSFREIARGESINRKAIWKKSDLGPRLTYFDERKSEMVVQLIDHLGFPDVLYGQSGSHLGFLPDEVSIDPIFRTKWLARWCKSVGRAGGVGRRTIAQKARTHW